jgi:hypothetical protein
MSQSERYNRIKKIFPSINEELLIDYLNYAQEGIDTLSDSQLDLDNEDFACK